MTERAAFLEFRDRPSRESLVHLLQANQGRVFRLCYHVLRHAHDAEDAAQAVLLKIVEEVRHFSDPDEFRRWVYRVSLNAALQAVRSRARRRAHEARAVMEKPAPKPPDVAERLALFEAIAVLDDGSRSLILERYFEGETLESISEKTEVSPSTIFTRLEEARESLRKRLGGALALPSLEALFPPAPAAPDLMTRAVLAKVAAGGGAVAAKSSIPALAIVAVLLLVTGSAVTVAVRRTSAALALPGASGNTRVSPGSTEPLEADGPPAPRASAPPTVAESAAPKDPATLLKARLDRFKKWWIAIKAEEGALSMDDRAAVGEFEKRWDREHGEHVSGLKDLILENPEGFLEFLRDKDNDAMIADLTRTSLLDQTDDPNVWTRKPFHEYPPQLMTGLLDLLQSGTVSQRWATLNLIGGFDDVPQEFKNVYVALLDHENEELQRISISLVMRRVPMTPAIFSRMTVLGTHSESSTIRRIVVSALASHPGPDAESFVLQRLVAATDPDELRQIMFSLQSRYRRERPMFQDILARSVIDSMAQITESQVFDLMTVATFLSGDRLKPILLQAMANTRHDGYRDQLTRAVARIDQGSFTRTDLMKILDAPRN